MWSFGGQRVGHVEPADPYGRLPRPGPRLRQSGNAPGHTGRISKEGVALVRQRSLICDGAGVPLGVAVDGVNRNDHKLARQTG
jgi:hypothetical protein